MTAVSFYKNLTLLDSARHRGLRFKPFDDVLFAATTQSTMLAMSEFAECAVEYPMVFAATPEGPVAIALFGLRRDENLFVDSSGRWDGRYIPAFLRRYPFLPATGPDGKVMIAIDDSCGNFTRSDGELLIDAEGRATPYLDNMIRFVEHAHADYTHAAAFAKSLADRGLLRDMNADIRTAGGQQYSLTGFRIVDEAKLVELSNADLARMARNGELAAIHAHLLSLRNLHKLSARLDRRLAAEATAPHH